MYAEERRQHILTVLRQLKRVDVADLAEQLNTSPETIRRDLREMEAENSLKRTHGGAIYIGEHKQRREAPLSHRKSLNFESKRKIARVAATLIEDGDVVAIDNSTTTFCMLEFIPLHFKLTIVTNSIPLVSEALSMADSEWTCICLGGVASKHSFSTTGSMTASAIGHFRPSKLFMSCAGIDADGNLTEGNLPDTEIKRELIGRSRQKYLLADAAKLGWYSAMVEGNIAEFDCLITNHGADRGMLSFVAERGVKVMLDNEL